MQLTGTQRKELLQAIISAYPNKADLERIVSFELEENLWAIAGGKNLTDIVFNLIKLSNSRRKLESLLVAAYNTNPDIRLSTWIYLDTVKN